MDTRMMPHSIEAEKSVLGAIILSKDALMDVVEVIGANDFYDSNHKEIFSAILDICKRNAPVDAITVSEELKKRGTLDMVGGRSYLSSLPSETPTTANAAEYAKLISENAVKRRLIEAANEIAASGFDETEDASALLNYAEKEIFDISQSKERGQCTPIQDVFLSNIERIDAASKLKGGLSGLTTGFKDLDEKLSGMQKSDLIILAARPAMGKTAFALSIALNASLKANASVLIFSLEMSKEQLGQRLLAMESRVDMQNLKRGTLSPQDWIEIDEALRNLQNAKIHVDDSAGSGLMDMRSRCRRMKAEHGLDLVIVDYMQLINPEGRSESKVQEISVISRNLKLMARELDCPVLVLSQLSRAPEARNDHRPMLSDLRESGSIEQDADVVIFLYRDEYYNPEDAIPGDCEVNIAKQRSGPTGTIHVTWLERITKFADSAGNIL